MAHKFVGLLPSAVNFLQERELTFRTIGYLGSKENRFPLRAYYDENDEVVYSEFLHVDVHSGGDVYYFVSLQDAYFSPIMDTIWGYAERIRVIAEHRQFLRSNE